jgi:hypothetical protein
MHSFFNMEIWDLELWTSQLIGNLKFSDFDIEFQSKWFGTWLSMSYVKNFILIAFILVIVLNI